MQGRGANRRTGGRSARVRAAVHQAVTELLAEEGVEAVTVAEVAARSGVHPTSLYRRWGTVEALVLDVAVSRVSAQSPIPDTGSLRNDLFSYASQAAADVGRPDGLAFLRAVITAADSANSTAASANSTAASASGAATDSADPRLPFLAARGAQIQTMLDRAAERGEPPLDYTDVLDGILAPIYLRLLFGIGGVDDAYLTRLVDHLLTVPVC